MSESNDYQTLLAKVRARYGNGFISPSMWLRFAHSGDSKRSIEELEILRLHDEKCEEMKQSLTRPDPSEFVGLPTWTEPQSAATFVLERQVLDEQFKKYGVTTYEEDAIKNILKANKCRDIDEFMKLPYGKQDGYTQQVLYILQTRYEKLEKAKPKVCDCGSKHTSFPNHHYHWCSIKK